MDAGVPRAPPACCAGGRARRACATQALLTSPKERSTGGSYRHPLHRHLAARLGPARHTCTCTCTPALSLLPRGRPSADASGLLHGHINEILILQPELLRGVVRGNALAIHHEAHLRGLEPQA